VSVGVRLSGAVVEAGGHRILGPLDLSIDAREHVLIVGPSGSGKTTLLRAVAGLAPLAAGRVELFGRTATDGSRLRIPPAHREIGFLFQDGALWPHMSVRRTLDFVLRHKGVPRRERAARAAEVLRLVDLEGYQTRMPPTLSGGERQRLALARALAASPRLLLLDEPLGSLDGERRRELLVQLRAVHERLELCILHVTHDPGEAASIASRTLELVGGRVPHPARETPARTGLKGGAP